MTWRAATVLLLAWACVPSSSLPQRFPPSRFNQRQPTLPDLELQRLGILSATATKPPVETSGDYSDAVYAARLATELTRLEENKKNIYVDFISSLYMNPEVRSSFPPDLQRLSRGAPSFQGPRRVVSTSSSSSSSTSFGPISGHPGLASSFGHRITKR